MTKATYMQGIYNKHCLLFIIFHLFVTVIYFFVTACLDIIIAPMHNSMLFFSNQVYTHLQYVHLTLVIGNLQHFKLVFRVFVDPTVTNKCNIGQLRMSEHQIFWNCFSKECVYAFMHNLHICLSFRIHMSKPSSCKSCLYTSDKD